MSTPDAPEPVIGKERLTAEDIAKINTALEATQGNRDSAAELLGMTRNRLVNAITNVPALNARWKSEKEVLRGAVDINAEAIINRVPPKALTLTDAEKRAIALTVNEKKMNRSLAKLGFKAQEIEAISSIEEFAGQFFKQTLDIMHGGMVKSAMRLMILAERIERDYLQDEQMEEKDRKWWWDQYFRILEQLRAMNEQSNKAALTKAIIEIKKKEQGGLGKPGFSNGASFVNINVGEGAKVKTSEKQQGWTPPPVPPSETTTNV